jgi:hypothetical protein
MATIKKRPLTAEEKLDAARLKAAWEDYRLSPQNKGATQAWLGKEAGLGNQSAVGQYLTGKIPLNHKALFAICKVLRVEPAQISKSLSATLPAKKTTSENSSGKMLLTYVDVNEMKLLTAYRESSLRGQQFILNAATSAGTEEE